MVASSFAAGGKSVASATDAQPEREREPVS
jgi:hypothetical protein